MPLEEPKSDVSVFHIMLMWFLRQEINTATTLGCQVPDIWELLKTGVRIGYSSFLVG